MKSSFQYILACDIGGTHITSAIVEKSNWNILEETIVRTHLNSSADAKSIFQSWANNINESINKLNKPISSIGIAMPGPFDYDAGISKMKNQDKYDALYNLNVSEGLRIVLQNESIDIKYINDAAAFLQGEVYGSKRENENCILGITLGTGLGSSVKNKNEKAFDADLWDEPYKESIYEEYLVTRWFTKRFYELNAVEVKGLKEIIADYQNTSSFDQLIKEYRSHLKDFLDFFSTKYKCKSFIIGGNIAKAWNIIDDKHIFSEYDIQIGQYAEKAALIGAASIFE